MSLRLEEAWRVRQAHFPSRIYCDYPLRTAVVSLTGPYCALNCAHCGGHYLRSMIPIWEAEGRLDQATSLLISGGCDPNGRVPVTEHLEAIKALRNNRRLNWHVGLISEEEARAIAPYVDVVSFDFVGDDQTIREVYGLNRSVDDYVETYRQLRRHCRVIPHITVGLRGGQLGHERKALHILRELGIEGLVVIVFIPTPGTRYALREPPPVEKVLEILVEARLLFPQVPISLGCMRPHGEYRHLLDPLAVRAGVNRIVSPTREAVEVARRLGLVVERTEECCALGVVR